MSKHAALEGMASALVRQGVSAEYAERVAAEFTDHHRDLTEELQSAGFSEAHAAEEATRRLGDARTLGKKTLREYQRRYWCGRWRWATFLFGPLPLMIVAWAVSALVTLCVVWPLVQLGVLPPDCPDGIMTSSELAAIYFIQIWYLFVLPAIVMLVIVRLARRAALSSAWVMLAACVVAAIVLPNECWLAVDSIERAAFLDGMNGAVPADRLVSRIILPTSWEQVRMLARINHAQGLIPLGIAGVFLLRRRQLAITDHELTNAAC